MRRALILWCLTLTANAYAWQQEYIADGPHSDSVARYTWDSDHQPRYEDVLAERIHSQERALQAIASPPAPDRASQMNVGWSLPMPYGVTTGPVAGWRWDGSSTAMYSDPTAASSSDSLWHAPVSTLGWRVDSSIGPVRPWAQVSYNQQFGDNVWKSQAGLHLMPASIQYGNWMDVSVGVDMPLTRHLAAWTSLSQSDGMTSSEDVMMYNLGVSANF